MLRRQYQMASYANTLGQFLADLMHKQDHNNSSLAEVAGVSESVIRNLLKHGIDPKAKDPDARTLRKVADALGVDSLKFFRLAGYLTPESTMHSVRADYLADVFDELPPEKQDAVLGVIEAMSEKPEHKRSIQTMRDDAHNPLAGFDLQSPRLVRLIANLLIAKYQISEEADLNRITSDSQILQYKWDDLPQSTQERVKALIRHKLSLDYDPTMVDAEWRD